MSGIAAIVNNDGRPVDPAQIEQLVQAIAWRGPDQQGIWAEGAVAMGAVQLWTTPEEWGTQQPLLTPQGDVLVLDGRIDNRPDLENALHISASERAALSDAALLWSAYQQWGTACVDHLAGAYAFIIWDATKQALFCARDPLGLRSLFYFWNGRHFYAASNIHALCTLNNVNTTLNDDYLLDYLTTSFSASYDVAATPFQEIQRLPGGHFLCLSRAGLNVTRYWKPWELSPIRYRQDADYAAHLKELFAKVVAAHCRTAGPIGVALSGGLDSSSVVAVARKLEQAGKLPAEALHTFTLVWRAAARSLTGYTDGDFADRVNAQYGGATHNVICDGMTMFEQVPHRGPVPQDEPHFHIYSTWTRLLQTVNQTGVRVLLTGVGADEGMAGSLFFVVDWLRRGRVREALRIMKYVADVTPHSYSQVFFSLVLAGLGPRSLAHYLHESQPPHSALALNTRYHARTSAWLVNPDQLLRRSLARHRLIPKNFKDIASRAQFEAALLLTSDNSRLWSDHYLGLPANIDQRYPFYDRRLIEFFARIPTLQKIGRTGERKAVMRQAMARDLPDAIRFRKGNTDYGFVIRAGFTRHWPTFQAMFTNSRAEAAGYIDGQAFLKVLRDKRLGAGVITDADIMPTLALEFWLREIESPVTAVPIPAPSSKAYELAIS